MDFSLSRVVEMFEERFGKRATTALVGVAGLAIAAISVRTIFNDLLRPTFQWTKFLIDNWPNTSLLRNVADMRVSALVAAVICLIAVVAVYSVGRWLILTRLIKEHRTSKETYEYARDRCEEAVAILKGVTHEALASTREARLAQASNPTNPTNPPAAPPPSLVPPALPIETWP
jgi:hypothetical protein